jgi:predicted kinase
MSDDLVKRLRDTPNWKREEYGDYKSAMAHYDRAPFEAANRIEELEAKLAKAVVALGQARNDAMMEVLDASELPQFAGNGLRGFITHLCADAKIKGEQP